jgi:hypothetical protein
MKLNLDLPKDKWEFIERQIHHLKKDSETFTLLCNAIESLSFEESWSQKIFQCLTSNGKNPFKFPSTFELQECTNGSGIVKQSEIAGIKWKSLEKQYYQFLLDHYSMEKK